MIPSYTQIVERALEMWTTDRLSNYVCDCIGSAADELTNTYPSELADILTEFVSRLIHNKMSVEQFLFKKSTWFSSCFSEEQILEANNYREKVIWPKVLDYAKFLDKQEETK